MALSAAIEYLLTVKTPEGRQIVSQAGFQVYIQLFPAGQRVVLNIPPAPGDYANILYQIGWSDEVNPGIFHDVLSVQGGNSIEVVLTSDWLREKADLFSIVTAAVPAHEFITNLSGLNQFYESTIAYLSIRNESDFKLVFDKLQHADIGAEVDLLLREFKRVLKQ